MTMNRTFKRVLVLFAAWVAVGLSGLCAKDGILPDSLSAAIIVKVLAFESSEHRSASIRIHVMDNEKLARQLDKFRGSSIGDRNLVEVSYGSSLVAGADVVIVSSKSSLKEAIDYATANGAIMVTNNPELQESGAALIVYDDEGLPGILLDRAVAKRDGLYWKPEILQIARIVGEL